MATDVDIVNAARELLDRHGERAVEVAKEHAEMLLKPECPVEAILPDTEGDLSNWVEHNMMYSELWPNITRMGTPPEDADAWRGVSDKMKHFSPNPGSSGGS